MYEMLKQYEYLGERTVQLADLREMLGVEPDEYTRWNNFRYRVIDSCQEALAENTDIKFTYEPIRNGRKGIHAVKFIIKKNEAYVDQLTLEEFINRQEKSDADGMPGESDDAQDDHLSFLAEACENEFTPTEMQVLYNLAVKIVPYQKGKNRHIEMYEYLKRKYDELKWRASKAEIKSRIGYLKKIMEIELEV